MSEKNIFEVAVRNKYRFPFRGQVSVEDLWDLSVQNLDSVFKTLNSQIKQAKEESLLDTKTKEDEVLDTQIEIVKYIVKAKQDEDNIRLQAKAKREQKQKLMAILSEKQESELRGKSADEIQKMLDELAD
jgi:regulator of protease activity HflC (stomatin/prohibitin superfamily)